ncbi:hypothetical protein [Rhodococcus sp. NPDC127528]
MADTTPKPFPTTGSTGADVTGTLLTSFAQIFGKLVGGFSS